MKFKTLYSAHEHHEQKSVSGERVRPNYKPKYNAAGAYELVPDGVLHSYDDVQSHAGATDMNSIIEKYIRTGDERLLQRRAAFFADTTGLPTNYGELHNMLSQADDLFNALPTEVKQQFGNSPALFYLDSKKADGVIADFLSKANPPKPGQGPAVEVPAVEVPAVDKGGVVSE